MAGHDRHTENGPIRVPHADAPPPIGAFPPLFRDEREGVEDVLLVPGATRAQGAGNRSRPEEADDFRTCFERDRDRILHSPAFRRLAGKTQVFIFPDDHQRTRLTHALEVAQVATAIARACRLNVPLTEAIALGHDCGHGPGGHSSEDALTPFLAGGYEHAAWGADVVLAPLNLCLETLDGIRNHSWSRPAPSTPEGEVVSFADRIAYSAHDLEDAVKAGVVDVVDLPADVVDRCGPHRSGQLRAFITDIVRTTSSTGQVAMSPALADALAALREFNYGRIYLRPASIEQGDAVVRVLRALVEHYVARPELVVDETGGGAHEPEDGTDPVRRAVTYVAGMTDRFACTQALHLLDWPRHELPRGFDVGVGVGSASGPR